MGMLLHYHLDNLNKENKSVVTKTADLNPKNVEKVETKEVVSSNNDLSYSKSDIARMNVESLKNLASEVGIEDYENKSGSQLKKDLVEYFNL